MSAYALSGVFSSQGCADEQIAYLQKLKEVNDKNLSDMIWYFVDMNHGLRELEREKELREFLSQVVFGRDWHRDVLECAADSYLALHDHERACEMYEMLLQKEPRNIRARLMIAHLSLVQGKSRQGLAALAPLHGLPPAGCELKARLLSQQGEHDKAYQEYKSLLEIHEKGSMGEKWKPAASFYDGITMTCLSLGKRDEALKYVKALYELDTEDAHGCNFYGYLLADFNQELDLAEQLIKKALAQEPDNAAYLDSLAWVRFRQGRYQEALNGMISVLENGGLSQDPDGELREHLAAILKTLGYEETAEFFQRQVDGMKK